MLLVVAGLPGAGKTTLADRLEASGVPVLDSDRVRRRWEARLKWLPYAMWRPFVHLAHWLAIFGVLRRGEPAILVRPFTTGWLRRLVLRRARIPAHLIALTATPDEARDGQHRRGRTVSPRSMRRHERAWADADFGAEGWAGVTRISRAEALTWTPALGVAAPERRSRGSLPPCRRSNGPRSSMPSLSARLRPRMGTAASS